MESQEEVADLYVENEAKLLAGLLQSGLWRCLCLVSMVRSSLLFCFLGPGFPSYVLLWF